MYSKNVDSGSDDDAAVPKASKSSSKSGKKGKKDKSKKVRNVETKKRKRCRTGSLLVLGVVLL